MPRFWVAVLTPPQFASGGSGIAHMLAVKERQVAIKPLVCLEKQALQNEHLRLVSATKHRGFCNSRREALAQSVFCAELPEQKL